MSIIKSVHWDITKNCNLRCKHCYNAEKYFNSDSEEYMKCEMTRDECLAAVDNFASYGIGHLHFLGGEPLVSPHIWDVIKHAKTKDMIITINSNACLLTDEISHNLINLEVEQFAASLDGCTASMNDAIRGQGTFEKVVSNMKKLNELKKSKNSKLETALVFTLTRKNLDELHMLPALANEIGVDLIVLTTFIESGHGKKNNIEFKVDSDTVCDKIESMVSSELKKYNIPLQIDMRPRFCEYLATVYDAPVIYNIKNSLCCAGEDMWYLEANGNIHPCLSFQLESGKQALKEGLYYTESLNINMIGMNNVENTHYLETFIKAKHSFETKKIPTCKGCSYVHICQPCFLDYRSYEVPIAECEWTKQKEKNIYNYLTNSKMILFDDVYLNGDILYKSNAPILIFENELAKLIYNKILDGKQLEDIFIYIKQEYEVDDEILKFDIISFICKLVKNHIIKLQNNIISKDE